MAVEDRIWTSGDGLSLHYRDYPGEPARTPVLCIPGLTRNARDFADVAARLSPGRRVIAVDLRGRGDSQWSPDFETYNAGMYLDDVKRLLDALGLARVVIFGTSLGGIIAMLLGMTGDTRLAGVLLNDIGPVIDEAGLERIRGYVGRSAEWTSWDEAAAAIAKTHAHSFPDYAAADWLAMARRTCRERDGAIVLDYDPAIAILAAMPVDPPPEPWRFLDGFTDLPVLLVRGALSDILSEATATEMARLLPGLELATVPGIGHPPMLDEEPAPAAIDRLLAKADMIG